MNESRPSEETLFEALSQLPGPERTAALLEACGEDPALRERLEILLAAHDRVSGFMAEPVAPPAQGNRGLYIPVAERLGDQIGPYKLLQQIGEGGCGVVYMAQQDKPMRRLVALKVIKLGMDTKQVVTRFEAERQALALMDHPNIAKVLDAGATESGRPFFVMELVRGIKITDYCDQNQLATAQRLDLFIRICRAVQHAHQKGVIHRDLKPSNILVTVNDGVPVPKVIDFGIAKATQGRLTDQTLVTAFDQFIGTPAYVSPEQAVLTNLDVDTRSDIYSLGVLLYELLTGKTPFDTQQLLATGLDELRRTICEERPILPSTRLSTMGEADLTMVAKARRVEPAKLTSLLRGDLDWIVMKCLEKDRKRRYETANGLAGDIGRHLHHEPVVARPPSRLYEFQKTVRRHWVGFAAGGAVLAALVIGLVASTLEATRARRAEQHATRIGESEAKARSMAEQRLYEAKLDEARAKRLSGVAGQRFESLVAIGDAAKIRQSRELGDEAVACLALTDLRVYKTFQLSSRWIADWAQVDNRFELYAYPARGGISVQRISSNEETAFLRVQESDPAKTDFAWPQFDSTSRYLAAQVLPEGSPSYWRVWDLNHRGALALDMVGLTATFTPDGEELAVAKDDGTLVIQNLASADEPKRLNLGARLSRFRFNPHGTRIAGFEAGSSTLQIWDLSSGQVLTSFVSPVEIRAVAWSFDGSLLASGAVDGKISIWDVSRGQLYRLLEGHDAMVFEVAFDHKGDLLASSGFDDTTRLWEVASGRALVVYSAPVSALGFSLDDQLLGCPYDGPKGRLLEVVHPTGYRRFASRIGTGHPGAYDLDFTPDSRLAAVCGESGINLVDLIAGQECPVDVCRSARSVHFDSRAEPGLWAPTGTGLYRWHFRFGSDDERLIQVEPAKNLLKCENPARFALDREEKRAVLTSWQATGAWLCNLQDPAVPPRFCAHQAAQFPAMDPAGRWAATGTWKGSGVKVWEFCTSRLIRELPVSGSASIAASPDGQWLATANDTEFRLWDTRSWSPAPMVIPAEPVFSIGEMAFSPDSRLLATCHDHAAIRISQVPTLQLAVRLILPYPMNVMALRFSPGGDKLAALEWSGVIHVWDLRVIRSELKTLSLEWGPPSFLPIRSERPVGEHPVRFDASPFSLEELAREIPARDTNTPASLIDLSAYYNAPLTVDWHSPAGEYNDLSELPRGLQVFGGVTFDVRGLVQIGTTGPNGLPYPNHVNSIPIGRSCQWLHFLHSAAVAGDAHKGDKLGSYIIHYVDGGQIEIPIVVGKDLADWWSQPNETNMNFVIAWTGWNPSVGRSNRTIRLFKTTWENPRPAMPIRQFDFVSDKPTPGSPFLVALTAEP